MPSRRTLRLSKYHISKDKYQELYYFCKQYWEREKEVNFLRGLSEVVQDGMPRGNSTSDPTFRKAEKILRLREENEIIEQAAMQACPEVYQQILKNVTEGVPYEYMIVPMGRRQFYEARRLFFKILSGKR